MPINAEVETTDAEADDAMLEEYDAEFEGDADAEAQAEADAEAEADDEPEAEPEVEQPKAKRPRKGKAAKAAEVSTEVAVVVEDDDTPAPLTERQAKALDKKIRAASDRVTTSTNQLIDLLEEAAVGQIHVALGYPSWTAWFGESVQIRPNDKMERKALAQLMSGRGMSQRAIASSLGVSQKTVDRDLEGAEDDSDTVTGRDGKAHPKAKARKESEPEEEIIDAEVVEDEDQAEAAPLKVAEIIDAFSDEMAAAYGSVNELVVLTQEAKWGNVRKRVAAAHLNNLGEVVKSLQDIIDDLMTA